MRITWYGHAAFRVDGENDAGDSVRVILDPYNYPACGGYLPIDDECDVVSVSHDNERYHSDTSAIRGDFVLLEALAIAGVSREIRGVTFEAVEVYEDAERRGPNAMVKFRLDGVTVAHQGDLGHPLDGPALDFLREVDVLLALTGGTPTIGLDDLDALVRETRPRLVVPMHFKTPKVNLDLLPLEAFLDRVSDLPIERAGASFADVRRETLPASTRVLVLEHAR